MLDVTITQPTRWQWLGCITADVSELS